MKQRGIVVGYVRVSTEDQAREGVSLEAQEAKIRAWWELNGEGRELVVFRDEGISGSRMDRPGLTDALGACQPRGALVAYSMSRIARSTTGMIELGDRLEQLGCELVSLSERIDTGSAAGRMVFQMLAVLGEFERRQTAERTSMALQHKLSRGERVSYMETSSAVAHVRAAELRTAGLSLRAVAAALQAEGVATVTGARWSAKVVRSLVSRWSLFANSERRAA
jgi:DNA invertase Pin-like site-specific DNA recombinase